MTKQEFDAIYNARRRLDEHTRHGQSSAALKEAKGILSRLLKKAQIEGEAQ